MSQYGLDTKAGERGGCGAGVLPKVLVVDDVQDNLDLLTDIFEEEPWNVKTAVNAKDAWDTIKRWHPDVVLLDIQMPEYNGHHLCTAIRMKDKYDQTAVVFLTSEWTTHADIERGLSMGATDYICKPIDASELRGRITSILREGGKTTVLEGDKGEAN